MSISDRFEREGRQLLLPGVLACIGRVEWTNSRHSFREEEPEIFCEILVRPLRGGRPAVTFVVARHVYANEIREVLDVMREACGLAGFVVRGGDVFALGFGVHAELSVPELKDEKARHVATLCSWCERRRGFRVPDLQRFDDAMRNLFPWDSPAAEWAFAHGVNLNIRTARYMCRPCEAEHGFNPAWLEARKAQRAAALEKALKADPSPFCSAVHPELPAYARKKASGQCVGCAEWFCGKDLVAAVAGSVACAWCALKVVDRDELREELSGKGWSLGELEDLFGGGADGEVRDGV